MKKIIKIGSIVLFGVATLQGANVKLYEVKSAKVTYEIKGNGNVMGMVQIKTIGKKRLIFDNYGAKNLEEKSEIRKETTMGKAKVKKSHTLTLLNGAVVYQVDFKHKRITRIKNGAFSLASMGSKDAKQRGEEMLKKMGGKKIGKDKVLGFDCDVWSIMKSVKQCIYKGVPLKIESNVMGLKITEIATKAEFDISIDKNNFNLPDLPIYNFDMSGKPSKIDKSKLEEMDAHDNAQAKVDAQKSKATNKNLNEIMEAAKQAGYDPKSGKKMTAQQKEAMMSAMMKARGGESAIVKQTKEKILKESESAIWAKDCFSDADTLKEANSCIDEGNKKFQGEKEKHFTSWTKADKAKMINEIDQFIKGLPCVKQAQTMKNLRKCMQ